MQLKHLIVFALAAIVILIGFNIFNSSRHEQNRALMQTASDTPAQTALAANDISNEGGSTDNTELEVTSKPLSEQPKAIIDKATTEVAQAQQAHEQRYLDE